MSDIGRMSFRYNNVISLVVNGWSPLYSMVAHSDGFVLRLYDWVNGEGNKPGFVGYYMGATGLVQNIASAVVIGKQGVKGEDGKTWFISSSEPANSLGVIGDMHLNLTNWDVREKTGASAWTVRGNIKGVKGDAFKYEDFTPSQLEGLKVKGDSGSEVELQKSSTHIQWKYDNSPTWINLVALTELRGESGKEVELRKTTTNIEWRLTGDAAWKILMPIADLKGNKGDKIAHAWEGTSLRLENPDGSMDAGVELKGVTGSKGWTPVLANIPRGQDVVHQVYDWIGGEGTKPTTGQYISETGYTADINLAKNIRGSQGASGEGTGDMLAATYDPQHISKDAFNRANHTGEQAISTITGLQEELGKTTPYSWEYNPLTDSLDLIKTT